MASKQVVNREKAGLASSPAATTHRAAIDREVRALLAPYLADGEAMPDVSLLVTLIARAIDDAKANMVAADEAHQQELADDPGARTARDDVSGALFGSVVQLREICTGLLGGKALATLNLSGPTPQDPVMLSRYVGEVVTALATAQLTSRIPGATFNAQDWSDRLKRDREALDGKLKEVARENREAEATLVARNAAMIDFDNALSRSNAMLTAFLRLAGQDELASRLRVARRKQGSSEEEGSETPVAPA